MAFRMLLKRVAADGALPFEPLQPNAETVETSSPSCRRASAGTISPRRKRMTSPGTRSLAAGVIRLPSPFTRALIAGRAFSASMALPAWRSAAGLGWTSFGGVVAGFVAVQPYTNWR